VLSRTTALPFLGSEAVAAGQVTRGRLQGPDFVPLLRDVFIGAEAEVDVGVRVRAVALRCGPDAVVAGPLAALAWNAECPWDDAEGVLPQDRRLSRDGVRLRRDRLHPAEVAVRFGVAVTSPARTAFDLARRASPLVESVAAMDALGFACGVRARDLERLLRDHRGARGAVDLRRVIELMDPLAESLMETRIRLVFVLRGLPPPVSQYRVRLPDGRTARLDLAWPEHRVGVEYDGEEHRSPERHADDLDRDALCRDLDWTIHRVTGRQVYRSPDATARRVARDLHLGL